MLPGRLKMPQRLRAIEQQFQVSPLQRLQHESLERKKIQLWMKRDDLIHPIVSGNKWRKLKYVIQEAVKQDCQGLVSMGGAYSNHLHALAWVARFLNIPVRALVRGECPSILNPTLQDITAWGMNLQYVSRSEYRDLRILGKQSLLLNLKPFEYWIPEGGALQLALPGVAEIVSEIHEDFDVLCLPCGTGTTLAGILTGLDLQKTVLGFAAVKGGDFLRQDILQMLKPDVLYPHWEIQLDYHFGGFAKKNADLIQFIHTFKDWFDIQLESVYTAKMCYGLFDLIEQDYFLPGTRIVALHTGGLQGNRFY
jgi:1-aminocyclopropane-1-carboxylate deaminase